MSKKLSRRQMITAGIATSAGAAGLAIAAKLAEKYGLVPPDGKGIYAPGTTLTYAAHRLLAPHSFAREFPRSMISKAPFANGKPPDAEAFKRFQAGGFSDWRLTVNGMVSHPGSYSISDLKALPSRSQITETACEEGWSYIAEWTGTPLLHLLEAVGTLPHAKFVVYFSIERSSWWDSIDMADALHPQTLLAYGFNGGTLPAPFGGPLRMRVPSQLGYKSVKYITELTVTDSLKGFGKGLGSSAREAGYSWYAGI